MQLADLRKEYSQAGLNETDLAAEPVSQFQRWLEQALGAQLLEPYAMTLATTTPDGWPSARVVLLRGVDERGFTFFTNYDGRKGRELARNPRAALVFYWAELERQVRVEGTVERVTAAESDEYFRGRPLGSRLGAWASPQSQPIAGREMLEAQWRKVEAEYASGEVPRPPNWGGVSSASSDGGVLAGTAESAARSAALSAGRGRRLDVGPAGAVRSRRHLGMSGVNSSAN